MLGRLAAAALIVVACHFVFKKCSHDIKGVIVVIVIANVITAFVGLWGGWMGGWLVSCTKLFCFKPQLQFDS